LKILLENYYNMWIQKCMSSIKKISWTPTTSLTFAGNESISGTSCVPSIGMSSSVNSKTPHAGASVKDKKRKGFSFAKPKLSPISPGSSGPIPSPIPSPQSTTCPSPPHPSHVRKASIGSAMPLSSAKGFNSHSEALLCKSREPAVSDDESFYPPSTSSSSSNIRLPSSVAKSIPKFSLEVPTLAETLASTHLRRMFFATFLDFRLGDDEKMLWNALSKFHADYVCWTDAELSTRQKEISHAAMKILEEYTRIPDRDNLMKCINESLFNVTSHFFYEAECKLYSQFHSSYQSFLVNNRWVLPSSS